MNPPQPFFSKLVTEHELRLAAQAIRRGDIVAFPTETVYGLGADAFQPMAVAKIFEMKGRPRFNPLIVHLSRLEELPSVAQKISREAEKLMSHFWPGPLTLVLKKQEKVPDLVTGGLDTVGVRLPKHPVAQALIREAQTPIAAPSANRFMQVSPTSAQHVRDSFGDATLTILDGGDCEVGLESTILDCTQERVIILRVGGTTVESLSEVLGYVPERATSETHGVRAPGMLARHYSPRTPLIFSLPKIPPARCGKLSFQSHSDPHPYEGTEVLSAKGDFTEAAAHFYSALRRLDEKGLDIIVAPLLPEIGLGAAINDRLRRAQGIAINDKIPTADEGNILSKNKPEGEGSKLSKNKPEGEAQNFLQGDLR